MNLQQICDKYKGSFVATVENNLRKLASDLPEFRYKTRDNLYFPSDGGGCLYNGPAKGMLGNEIVPAGPDCSGCIFGQALQLMGWDDENEMRSTTAIIPMVSPFTNEPIPHSWEKVQSNQDDGVMWSKAVEYLDK